MESVCVFDNIFVIDISKSVFVVETQTWES